MFHAEGMGAKIDCAYALAPALTTLHYHVRIGC